MLQGNTDWLGMFLAVVNLSYLLVAFVIPFFLVYNHMDPFWILSKIIQPTSTESTVFHHSFLFFRISFFFVASYIGFSSVRAFMSRMLYVGAVGYKLISHMHKRMDLSVYTVEVYREVAIALSASKLFFKHFVGFVLSAIFFGMFAVALGTIVGWKFVPWNIYIVAPLFLVLIAIYLPLGFKYLCAFYEGSDLILKKWRNQLGSQNMSGFNRKLVRRQIRSLHRLAMPAGNIGIMDTEIKVHYFESLLDYIIDVLVTFQDYL